MQQPPRGLSLSAALGYLLSAILLWESPLRRLD